MVGGLIGSVLLDLGAHGVALVGPVPRGLPLPQVPSIDVVSQNFSTIAIAAFALLLIGFSQTAGDAQAFATKHRYRVDLNQESVAQGMANIGAGVFQGMPVSTSLSASSLNESAGARTPLASIATGAIVVATLILLAPLFADLPKAILAAVIIDAVIFGMIDVAEFRRLFRVKRVRLLDRAWRRSSACCRWACSSAWSSASCCRCSGSSTSRPDRRCRSWDVRPGTHVYRDLDENPGDETDPGVAVIRIDGGLFFATAAALDERVRAILASQPELHSLVLDLEGVNFVDSQGAAKLTELHELTDANGVELRLARVKPDVARRAGGGWGDRPDRARPDPRQRPPRGQGGTGSKRQRDREQHLSPCCGIWWATLDSNQ